MNSTQMMMIRVLALATVMAAGCGGPRCFCRARTTPVPAPSPQTAQLTFLAPSSTVAVYMLDSADGRLLATTYVRSRMTVELPPGPRTIVVASRRSTDVLQVNLAPGRRYYALVRYLAVPFGPDMAIRALTPRSEDWSRLPDYLAQTGEYEIDPEDSDPALVDRTIRHFERRQREALELWAGMEPAHQAERTLGPDDAAPM